MFDDRQEAGELLAGAVQRLDLNDPVILALPRGGVPVAIEIANRLKAPLDLLIVRKIGAPSNRELAIGAVIGSDPPDIVINKKIFDILQIDREQFQRLVDAEVGEIARRKLVYLGSRKAVPLAGRTAIIVDDGIATGSTIKVAIQAVKKQKPDRIVIAVPVAPPDIVGELEGMVDLVVCLSQPRQFLAVGSHYANFDQVDDASVVEAMKAFDQAQPPAAGKR